MALTRVSSTPMRPAPEFITAASNFLTRHVRGKFFKACLTIVVFPVPGSPNRTTLPRSDFLIFFSIDFAIFKSDSVKANGFSFLEYKFSNTLSTTSTGLTFFCSASITSAFPCGMNSASRSKANKSIFLGIPE